jgi:hypothetical protein
MRRLALCLALLAAPATVAAQTATPRVPDDVWMQQQLDRQRAVALENELNAREATRRADEAVRSLQAMGQASSTPSFDVTPAPRTPPPPGAIVSIPDARLAASNARVKAAAENRR